MRWLLDRKVLSSRMALAIRTLGEIDRVAFRPPLGGQQVMKAEYEYLVPWMAKVTAL